MQNETVKSVPGFSILFGSHRSAVNSSGVTVPSPTHHVVPLVGGRGTHTWMPLPSGPGIRWSLAMELTRSHSLDRRASSFVENVMQRAWEGGSRWVCLWHWAQN